MGRAEYCPQHLPPFLGNSFQSLSVPIHLRKMVGDVETHPPLHIHPMCPVRVRCLGYKENKTVFDFEGTNFHLESSRCVRRAGSDSKQFHKHLR